MTETEITLFKELIRETVRSVLTEEKLRMAEEVKKTFAKDLKEIKLLIAKQIKEGRERPATIVERVSTVSDTTSKTAPLSEGRAAALRNVLSQTARGMGVPVAPPATPANALKSLKESKLDATTKSILMQTAMSMTEDDQIDFVPGNELREDNPEPVRVHYSAEEVEEAYEPKFSRNIPNM